MALPFNYEYFSGANVTIEFLNADNKSAGYKQVLECAGLSFSYQNSQQPIYSYASSRFDAMLPGREIIQGNFLVNYIDSKYVDNLLNSNPQEDITFNGLLSPAFDIKIQFGSSKKTNNMILKYCYIISMGQTIQISDQVIIQEYSFLGRSMEGNV